jgi:hypothetical protein
MADLQQIVNVVNGELDSDNVQDGSLHATDMAVGQAGLASQAVSVRRTATQQINVGLTSKVQLNVEDFDLSSVFDAVTNYRYVPTVPGIYRVSASTSWVTFDSWVQTLLYKNGTLLQTLAFARNTLATGGTFGGSCLVQLNGTDYLELFASQGDTANHNMNAAYFCAELVGRI